MDHIGVQGVTGLYANYDAGVDSMTLFPDGVKVLGVNVGTYSNTVTSSFFVLLGRDVGVVDKVNTYR